MISDYRFSLNLDPPEIEARVLPTLNLNILLRRHGVNIQISLTDQFTVT